MIVLFLDIDGCMISHEWRQVSNGFTPDCVVALNDILHKTNARIVITSSLRLDRTLQEMKELFTFENVLPNRILGMTPFLDSDRGVEILRYLNESSQAIDDYVIIDDFMDDIEVYFSQEKILEINPAKGLTFKDSEIIADRLNARRYYERS